MPASSSTTVTRLAVSERTLTGVNALPLTTPPVSCSKVNDVLNSAGAFDDAWGNMNLRVSMPPNRLAPAAASPPMIIRNCRLVVSARTRILPRGDSYGFSAIQSSRRGSSLKQVYELAARTPPDRGSCRASSLLQEWVACGRGEDIGEHNRRNHDHDECHDDGEASEVGADSDDEAFHISCSERQTAERIRHRTHRAARSVRCPCDRRRRVALGACERMA